MAMGGRASLNCSAQLPRMLQSYTSRCFKLVRSRRYVLYHRIFEARQYSMLSRAIIVIIILVTVKSRSKKKPRGGVSHHS